MSHVTSLQKTINRKCLMQSHYRRFSAGNVSCNLITEDCRPEISHAMSLKKCLMQSHSEDFQQEMAHAISLQKIPSRKCLVQSHYRRLSAGRNISCNLIAQSCVEGFLAGMSCNDSHIKHISTGNVLLISLQESFLKTGGLRK